MLRRAAVMVGGVTGGDETSRGVTGCRSRERHGHRDRRKDDEQQRGDEAAERGAGAQHR